jgi:hypothetical protein
VNANLVAELQIRAQLDGSPTMGAFRYDVDIDEALFASLAPGADLQDGHLIFRVPAGEYDATFTAADGTSIHLLFVAQ